MDGFVTTKRTADGGIDGRLYFDVPGERDFQSMIIEVKGGQNVTIPDLRALHSVLEREEALMAGLIIMHSLGDTKRGTSPVSSARPAISRCTAFSTRAFRFSPWKTSSRVDGSLRRERSREGLRNIRSR